MHDEIINSWTSDSVQELRPRPEVPQSITVLGVPNVPPIRKYIYFNGDKLMEYLT